MGLTGLDSSGSQGDSSLSSQSRSRSSALMAMRGSSSWSFSSIGDAISVPLMKLACFVVLLLLLL